MTSRSLKYGGFSLVEVLVALVVVSIGLLGLAKMQSVAVASTTLSGNRSVVALEAASLAAMMHANPDYWQNNTVPAVTTISSTSNPVAGTSCLTPGTTACSPQQMAQYDLYKWGLDMSNVLPVYIATITCAQPQSFATSCVIQIQWPENGVAMDAKQTQMSLLNGASDMVQYSLYVQP